MNISENSSYFGNLLNDLFNVSDYSDRKKIVHNIYKFISTNSDRYDFSKELWEIEEKLLIDLRKKLSCRLIQLALPGIFSRCGVKPRHPETWGQLAQILFTQSVQFQGSVKFEIMASVAAHQAMATTPQRAMSYFLKIIVDVDLGGLSTQSAISFGLFLAYVGWLYKDDLEFRTHLYELFFVYGQDVARCERWILVLLLLGFHEKFSQLSNVATAEFLGFLFHNIAMPIMEMFIKNQRHNLVFFLEGLVAESYSRVRDTADHYQHVKFQTTPRLLRYGRIIRANLPPLPALPAAGQKQKVLFFLCNTFNLAHSRFLLNYLKGIKEMKDSQIIPYLSCHHYIKSTFTDQIEAIGVELYQHGKTNLDVVLDLRKWCAENQISAFVYVSNTQHMPIYFGAGIAPVQIYLSLKYHVEIFQEVDGILTSGSFQKYRQIRGRQWRAGHTAILDLYDSTQTEAAQAARAELLAGGHDLVLASFGREVKYNNDDYVAALSKIMQQLPNALFLWTGRSPSPEIIERFQRFGIADRCRFIGWVNTALYAQVIDLYVDTFPFASGHTAMEAMAAGCPVVLLATQEALDSSIATHVLPAYRGTVGTAEQQHQVRTIFTDTDGSSLLPMVDHVEDYIDWSVKLGRDPELRSRAGAAARRFVQESLGDVQQMARDYNQHILEIIDARRQNPGAAGPA